MKKKEVQKLQLSRETLRELKNPDAQKVVGGHQMSCPSMDWTVPDLDQCGCCDPSV